MKHVKTLQPSGGKCDDVHRANTKKLWSADFHPSIYPLKVKVIHSKIYFLVPIQFSCLCLNRSLLLK